AARREPRQDDRRGLGPDEPRDAADVDLVGDVLLLLALPERDDSVREGAAAHGPERRPARRDDRWRRRDGARHPDRDRGGLGCRELRGCAEDLSLAVASPPDPPSPRCGEGERGVRLTLRSKQRGEAPPESPERAPHGVVKRAGGMEAFGRLAAERAPQHVFELAWDVATLGDERRYIVRRLTRQDLLRGFPAERLSPQ